MNIYKICYHDCGVMNSLVAQINFQPMRILETRTGVALEFVVHILLEKSYLLNLL